MSPETPATFQLPQKRTPNHNNQLFLGQPTLRHPLHTPQCNKLLRWRIRRRLEQIHHIVRIKQKGQGSNPHVIHVGRNGRSRLDVWEQSRLFLGMGRYHAVSFGS
jgi:hypothetical protein